MAWILYLAESDHDKRIEWTTSRSAPRRPWPRLRVRRPKAARREQAITALSGIVGAMVVARLVNDSALSHEILTVAASAFGGHTNNNQKRNAK
jgi:hypothetical protein